MKPIFLMILALAAYLPLIGATTVSPDAHIILRPLLDTGFIQYLEMLQNFRTVDFQPVRDLTFFFDIAVLKMTGFNSFALTNVLLWGIGCNLIYRFLRRKYPDQNPQFHFLATMAFTVYPLFSQAVSWSMARKHVLAFVLILSATHFFFDWLEGKKKWGWFFLFYVLAVLSQPITVFWSLWVITHLFILNRETLIRDRSLFGILCVTMIALLLMNYTYYTILNDELREYYTQAKPEFSLYRLFLHASFYFRELLWPYQLSFVYYPTLENSILGTVAILLCFLVIILNRRNKQLISWIVFALVPFPVFLGISVYDQYLILPATGLFIAFIPLLEKYSKRINWVLPAFVAGFSVMTFCEAKMWTQDGALWLRNFQSAPSCRSAIQAMSSLSQSEIETPQAVLDFYKNDNCFSVYPKLPAAEKPKAIVAEALYYFHSSNSPEDEEVNARLRQLGNTHYFPLLLYAVRMSKINNLEEVKNSVDFVFDKAGGPLEDTGPIVQKTLGDYCRTNKMNNCLTLLSGDVRRMPYK